MTLTNEFLGTFSLTTSASFWGAGGRFCSMSLFVPHNASPNRTCTTASLFVVALSQTSVVILERSRQSTGAVRRMCFGALR